VAASATTERAQSNAGDEHRTTFGERLIAALTRRWVIVMLWLAAAIRGYGLFRVLGERANQWDFSHYYASALALREGLNPYTTNLTAIANRLGLEIDYIVHGTYPPTFILLFQPLTLFNVQTAFWIWIAINAAAFALSVFLLIARNPAFDTRLKWALVPIAMFYPPVLIHFYYAQSQIVILLLLILMMRASRAGYDGATGFLLALASLLRGFPILLVGYLLARRRWRALWYAAGWLAAGALLTLGAMGAGNALGFLKILPFLTNPFWLSLHNNVALQSFVLRLFAWFSGPHPGYVVGLAANGLSWLGWIALLGVTVFATSSPRREDDEDWRGISLWVVTMVLLSPTAWAHYLVLLIIPFASIAAAANRGTARAQIVWLAAASYVVLISALGIATVVHAPPGSTVRQMLAEGAFVSLAIAWFAAYRFAVEPAPAESR
jgi:hypothetical protein